MNAGTIAGYITRRDGSPVSGAEIRIFRTGEFGGQAKTKPAAKTDSRGYFQLTFAEVVGDLNISIGGKKGIRTNSKSRAENSFQVTGYLINESLKADA